MSGPREDLGDHRDAAASGHAEEMGAREDRSERIGPPGGGYPPPERALPSEPAPRPTPSPSPGPAPQEPASPARPLQEPPSPEVTLAADASPLPGAHRGGFSRLPTAPVDVTTTSAPAEPGADAEGSPPVQWLTPAASTSPPRLAPWALAFSVAGLVVSLFVGWGFPIGLVGAVTALVALRRPLESRSIAVWALVLGLASVIYSAGWLLWAASRTNLLG